MTVVVGMSFGDFLGGGSFVGVTFRASRLWDFRALVALELWSALWGFWLALLNNNINIKYGTGVWEAIVDPRKIPSSTRGRIQDPRWPRSFFWRQSWIPEFNTGPAKLTLNFFVAMLDLGSGA